ncbi:MAG: hypothetical protein ACF787_05190, partial [Rhodopirellula sp. JB053]
MSNSSELIYTSAPQGLRPGSRGFCTVAMSDVMPAGLVGPLEGLSAYSHSTVEGPAPVNYMHVQIKVVGRPVNVLSRVAEAPPDYTGRTNKIAHHVVVAPTDRAAGGPAAVLRQPGFAAETWDGVVRKIPEPKTVPSVDSSMRVAQLWAELCGDAGWAGTVASFFDGHANGAPLYLLHQPEQNPNLLTLIDEAICLLPESKRWNATFSTYTGELPPGTNCRLRCLIADSPEALSLTPTAYSLDLNRGKLRVPTGEANTPPPNRLVDAARSGQPAPTHTDEHPESATNAEVAIPLGLSDIVADETLPTEIEAVGMKLTSPPPPSTPSTGRLPPPVSEAPSPRSNYIWLLTLAPALVLLCLGTA